PGPFVFVFPERSAGMRQENFEARPGAAEQEDAGAALGHGSRVRNTWPALRQQDLLVRTGRVELPCPCGRWNLNPVRLPVPPRSHDVHYIGSPGVSRRAAETLGRVKVREPRSLAAAAAGCPFQAVAVPVSLRGLDVQTVVRLALGRQQ